jgi:hypothetical protein
MLRQSHVGIARHNPLSQTTIAKKGKDKIPSPFSLVENLGKVVQLYLVFPSSFFSAGLSGIGAASLAGSLGAGAGAGSAGAAGAGGGGGGGAGSSFLPHPTNVSVKAKSIMADNETNFFPMVDSPPFPSLLRAYPLKSFYRITGWDIQAGFGVPRMPKPACFR